MDVQILFEGSIEDVNNFLEDFYSVYTRIVRFGYVYLSDGKIWEQITKDEYIKRMAQTIIEIYSDEYKFYIREHKCNPKEIYARVKWVRKNAFNLALCLYDNLRDRPICDGKSCGTGKYTGRGKYLCVHNNFAAVYPQYVPQWDHERNKGTPADYFRRSRREFWWKCTSPTACKYGCHRWKTSLDRKANGCHTCLFCCGRYVCEHEGLAALYPHLMDEWDYEKNGSIDPRFVSPASNKKYWWYCKNGCGCHSWPRTALSRTRGSRCPFCMGREVCTEHKNFATVYKDLLNEWDHENNTVLPNELTLHSDESVHWICSSKKNWCGCHRWTAKIYARTGAHRTGCPFCVSRRLCPHNNFAYLHKELLAEWDFSRNVENPYKLAPNACISPWWICSLVKSHRWKAPISNRINGKKTGCPKCRSPGFSKQAMNWLHSVEEKEGISLRHAKHPEGEYKIPSIGKVDGYHPETKTVYEYHGSYWHGDPSKYNPSEYHPISKKTFGELYEATLKRDERIRASGYTLIVRWESEKD